MSEKIIAVAPGAIRWLCEREDRDTLQVHVATAQKPGQVVYQASCLLPAFQVDLSNVVIAKIEKSKK